MNSLVYTILRYAPSLVSGETINLAAIFYCPSTYYREFYTIKNWSRVRSFDDSVSIPMLRDIILDIGDSLDTMLSGPLDLKQFCAAYHNELHFSEAITLDDVDDKQLNEEIEKIKRLYFPMEYSRADRPRQREQKSFLSRILKAKNVSYKRDKDCIGTYNERIHYDYVFGHFGVKFFNLNKEKITTNTVNSVKAWAWNCYHNPKIKTIIFFDSANEESPEIKSLINILKASTDLVFNVHNGFSDLDRVI